MLRIFDAKLQHPDDFFSIAGSPLDKELTVKLLDTILPVFSKPYERSYRPMGRRHCLEAGVSGAGITAGTYARMLCNMSGMARVVNGASMLG